VYQWRKSLLLTKQPFQGFVYVTLIHSIMYKNEKQTTNTWQSLYFFATTQLYKCISLTNRTFNEFIIKGNLCQFPSNHMSSFRSTITCDLGCLSVNVQDLDAVVEVVGVLGQGAAGLYLVQQSFQAHQLLEKLHLKPSRKYWIALVTITCTTYIYEYVIVMLLT